MNMITEASSQYVAQSSPIVKKWATRITEVNSLMKETGRKGMSLEAQIALAKVLENTQKRMNYSLNEATQSDMVGPYKRYALDIITGMFPNLIAMDLVNVQPLENKYGIINYVKYTAGSTKYPTTAGDEIATTFNYTGSNQNYTGQICPMQALATPDAGTTLTATVPWAPVVSGVAGSVEVDLVIGTTTYVLKDNGADVLSVPTGGTAIPNFTSGAINYATGAISLVFSASTTLASISASWLWNNEYAPAEVPQINLEIVSLPVLAKSRKLKALWSFDASYELQKEYGQDLNGLLAAQSAAEIAHEIDVEILNDLHTQAYGSALTWSAIPPYGVSQAAHYESLKTVFNQASNQIFQRTKRAMGNFVVVGTNVATVLESTPSFQPASLGNNVGPYFLGTWGGFKIYKNPFYDPNAWVVGYKGDSLFDAGYCYAPYMPVMTTQMLMLADFQGQQGWATSYGKIMLNNNMYVKGNITGITNPNI